MKTAKLTIGIISIVLFAFIAFQSCAVGLGNTILDNGESSGSSGLFLSLCMLIAGIVGICTRKRKSGGYIAGGFYVLGGLVGITSFGSFSDLKIWSILCFIFASVFILGSVFSKDYQYLPAIEQNQNEFKEIDDQDNPQIEEKKKINIWAIILPILIVIAIAVWYPLLYPFSTNDDPEREKSTNESESNQNGITYEFDLQFFLKAGEKGDYGQLLTYNEGTEFETIFYAYYVPVGNYLASNSGSYATQINVYSNERRIVNGIEEPKDVRVYLLEKAESKEIEVPDGYHIEISVPAYLLMSKIKEGKNSASETKPTEPNAKITGFEFSHSASMELSIDVGKTEKSFFIVKGDRDFSIDDIMFVSSNESIAKIEFESQTLSTYIYYKITPISEGTATLYVQTKDGSVKSDEISVSVYDPNKFQYEIIENYYISGNNSLGNFGMHCFVVLKNTGETNIYLNDATFDIEDSNNHLVASEKYVAAYPNVIAPGEKAVYYTSLSLDNGSMDETYKITPRFEATRAKVSHIRFSITDTSVTQSGVWIKTTGRVENTSEKEESLYYVVVFFYDKNDKLIGIDYTYPDEIKPGEKVGFETSEYFSYSQIKIEDIARYETIAYPNQYQWN